MTVELVNAETGEVIDPMPEAEARRLTTEARSEFRSSVDHFERGWSLVERAVRGGGYLALGYRSASDYLSVEFGDVLAGLDVPQRRLAVRELSALGMSTRTIAPVVGVSNKTVSLDRRQVLPQVTPEPTQPEVPTGYTIATDTVEPVVISYEAPHTLVAAPAIPQGEPVSRDAAPRIIGRDGKTYTRPALVPPPARDYAQENAEAHCRELANALDVLWALTIPEAFERSFADWAVGAIGARPSARERRTPTTLRAIADALNDYADHLEGLAS